MNLNYKNVDADDITFKEKNKMYSETIFTIHERGYHGPKFYGLSKYPPDIQRFRER